MHESRQSERVSVVYCKNSSGTILTIFRTRHLSGVRLYFLFFLLLVAAASQACGGGHALVRGDTAELGLASPRIAWFGPSSTTERATLARWRQSVGPAIVPATVAADPGAHDALTIVSWNTAVGEGDIVQFVRSLPQSDAPLVLLLQEVYRDGPEVPAPTDRGSAFTRQLGNHRAEASNREIDDAARTLNLNVYYVPSMRNGNLSSAEDRGNAILSSLPLDELRAIELPFERQRRVAVSATIRGRTSSGDAWRLRVVSAHLDNLGGIRRGWIGSEYGRARQARSLTELLGDDESTILAGDFNTWFGFSDQAYVETARAFPDTRVSDRRATFRGLLRLDHIFVRLVPGWHLDFHRASSRFGSDHYPLVGTLRFH
jgi:endonuclease/exonuclease/phosphatase family metal-dependent hydrolase